MNDVQTPGANFVCRCEELTERDIRDAVVAGARTINDTKRRTRAGMGICQGAYCLDHVARILAEQSGTDRAAVTPMTSRPPARMVTLGSLAANKPDR